MTTRFVADFFVVAFVGSLFFLGKRFFPNTQADHKYLFQPIPGSQIRRMEWQSWLAFVVVTITSIWVWQFILNTITAAIVFDTAEYIFVDAVGWDAIFVYACFLGAGTMLMLQPMVLRILMPRQFQSFMHRSSQKSGFNIWRAGNVLGRALLIVVAAISLMRINTYVKVTTDTVIVSELFSLRESHYSVASDISGIEKVTYISADDSGGPSRMRFKVFFTDEVAWWFDSYAEDEMPTKLSAAIGLIAKESGQEIQAVTKIIRDS